MNNFIGPGERSAIKILCFAFDIEEKGIRNYPNPGLYVQVPLVNIIHPAYLENLDPIHQKGSIDILVVTQRNKAIAFRVQGGRHQGHGPKPQRDSVQLRMLTDKQLKGTIDFVVDLHLYECPELFKEHVNHKSIAEVCNSIAIAGVPL